MDLVDKDVKVVVVYDSDTYDELGAEERNEFIKSQILNGEKDEDDSSKIKGYPRVSGKVASDNRSYKRLKGEPRWPEEGIKMLRWVNFSNNVN